jgi:monofunctional biosynthetic peptidoglycan transglycosylase
MLQVTKNLLIAFLCLIGLFVVGVALFFVTIPRPTHLRTDCFTTEWHKVHLCPKDKTYAHSKQISRFLKAAVISSEDTAFYQHKGIDWYEVQQSFEKNWKLGHFARGGSTITQQLAKNAYLSGEKSILRKVREAIIAVQIEKALSKEEILEKYLNVVEFGDHIYGVTAAAQFYFHKTPAQLSAVDGAFLAFLLPSPKKYSASFRNRKLTPFARKSILSILFKMQSFRKISAEEHDEAVVELANLWGSAPELENELNDYNDDGELDLPIDDDLPASDDVK